MNTISANELKSRGVGAIDEALTAQSEVSVSVRGQIKYIVMSKEHYQYLRECEQYAALAARWGQILQSCLSRQFLKFKAWLYVSLISIRVRDCKT